MTSTNLKYLLILVIFTFSCSQKSKESEDINFEKNSKSLESRWLNSESIFESNNIKESVKEPSLINFDGEYHIFYTFETDTKKGIKYTSATTLNKLNYSERIEIENILDGEVINPQVFYFEPQKLWYLFASTNQDLLPVFSTNTNINIVENWTPCKKLNIDKSIGKYYTIADNDFVYIFYLKNRGELFYSRTEIAKFPEEFSIPVKVNILGTKNLDSSNIPNFYYSERKGKYIAIAEIKDGFKVFTSESLDGVWNTDNRLSFDINNIFNTNGSTPNGLVMKNPDVLHEGYNQNIKIQSLNIIYQSKKIISNNKTINDTPSWDFSLITQQINLSKND